MIQKMLIGILTEEKKFLFWEILKFLELKDLRDAPVHMCSTPVSDRLKEIH